MFLEISFSSVGVVRNQLSEGVWYAGLCEFVNSSRCSRCFLFLLWWAFYCLGFS